MRALRSGGLVLACLLASCGNKGTIAPELKGDYYISARDAKLAVPESSYSEGRYSAKIVRHYKDEKELRLLRIAESVYPSRQRVMDARATAHFKETQEPPAGEDLWWTSSFDGVRIPYTITGSALLYYCERVRDFRTRAASTGRAAEQSCVMSYVGDISHQKQAEIEGKRFTDCYVVSMKLEWSWFCGDLCGLWFTKERTVVLDAEGTVLAVFKDGPADFIVS
ncbi:MAG: hypothetical protein IT365_19410 [Candidatus Hydrogenedentes bacterium]|nr:hypothetical protein [Candidatus Hydrogenedentota bacterium]